MLKIGITGGIGSGKTTVCKVFKTLGIPVFYADVVAKQIMVNDINIVTEIKNTFGQDCYFKNGTLNNKYLANIVFNQADKLKLLNKLVHPAVFKAFSNWLLQIPVATPYVLKEAALLFESASHKMCDKNILVTAPLALKLQRVTDRDKVTEQEVIARMDKQFTDEEKLKMANFVINNNETESIILQVQQLHQQFTNKI